MTESRSVLCSHSEKSKEKPPTKRVEISCESEVAIATQDACVRGEDKRREKCSFFFKPQNRLYAIKQILHQKKKKTPTCFDEKSLVEETSTGRVGKKATLRDGRNKKQAGLHKKGFYCLSCAV
jgi:hypothetical protein